MSNYGPASVGNIELQKALNGLSQKANGIPATTGNVYFVIPSTDSNYEEFYDRYQHIYQDGTYAVHNTIADAYSAVTSNRHDLIMLSANSAHAQTSMLTIAKNRVHFAGFGFRGGSIGMGARARITLGVTVATTDVAVMKNTGIGNTFDNIKFDSGNTVAEGLYAVVEAGEYAIYRGCEFYLSSQLAVAGGAELAHNGDSTQYIRCTFGSSINAIVGAIIRPCVTLTTALGGAGKFSIDTIFEECIFLRKCGNVANRFIYGANATDVARFLWFKGCMFFSNPEGAATPALAIDMAAAQTAGAIVVDQNCLAVDVTLLATTAEGSYVVAPVAGTYADRGLATNT